MTARRQTLIVLLALGVIAFGFVTLGGSTIDTTADESTIDFLGTYEGRPITWDACQPISWVFNSGSASQTVIDEVHAAIATMAAETGFEFTFVGYTERRQPQGMRADRPDADLHIEIVPDFQTDLLAMSDWGNTDIHHKSGLITGAVVALNADGAGFHAIGAVPRSWHSLTVHELGHVIGLGHSKDRADLMYEEWSETPASLSDNDLASARILRDQSSC